MNTLNGTTNYTKYTKWNINQLLMGEKDDSNSSQFKPLSFELRLQFWHYHTDTHFMHFIPIPANNKVG